MKPLLIVGAGPVGLTLACELTRYGIPIRVIDRSPRASDKSKALVLWPRTLELFHKSQAVQPFLDAGSPVYGMSIFENIQRRLAHISFEDLPTPYPFVLCIPQYTTESILNQRLQDLGVQVDRQCELVSLQQTPEGVVAELHHADGRLEQMDTPWLLACDGGRSRVRKELGIRLEGDTVAQEFAMADAHVSGLPITDEVLAFVSPAGVCAAFPIEFPDRYRIFILRSDCPGEGEPQAPTLEEMQEQLELRGLGQIRLKDPFWLAAFRINERHAQNYRHGRVLLAGDAAHVHSPVGGQGMNTGMQDAFNLAWKLAYHCLGRVPENPWIDSYSNERQPVGASVVAKTRRARQMITLRHPVAAQIRNKVVGLLSHFDFVRHKVGAEAAELSIHYPQSPLHKEECQSLAGRLFHRHARAGERAPDGELQDSQNGIHTRVFELTVGTDFHLLLFSGPRAVSPSDGLREIFDWTQALDWLTCHWIFHPNAVRPEFAVWLDEDDIHQRYGASEPACVLVRPDGYVALHCQPAALTDLQRYFQSLGVQVPKST